MVRTKRRSAISPAIPSSSFSIPPMETPIPTPTDDDDDDDTDHNKSKNICSVCGRAFSSNKGLAAHMRAHPDRQWRGIKPPSRSDIVTTTAPAPPAAADVLSPESLSSLVSLLTSATSLSLRFLSDADLLLLPSQSLSLTSSLRSSSLSLSNLISHLPPEITSSLPPLPPPPPPPPFSWFRRFLSSSPSSDPLWIDHFRMSKPSFYLLLQTLSPSLTSPASSPLPPDHKLAAALFRLAHAAPFSHVAARFGLGSPSLACRAFYESCKAAADRLAHLFELSSDADRVVQGFNWMTLPSCCGVVSYSRFPLRNSSSNSNSSASSSSSSSVVAQCVIDSEGRFLDVSAGWPGSMSPVEILARTKLYSSRPMVLGIEGRYFLGGACCPLLPWLLTPFKGASGDPREAVFNTVHARGMELATRAFARVRARWRLLGTEWKEECAEALPYVVVAACLLHNYLIKCSEPLPAAEDGGWGMDWCAGFEDYTGPEDERGEKVRNVLASCMSQVICK